ncbi:MAG: YihY/virulence factor BrkB family protein [Calditrichota bacterium]
MFQHLNRIYKSVKVLITATFHSWQEHHINWLAAGLAYYAIFSLAPTFLLVVTGGGFFFGEEAVTGEIVQRLSDLMGYENAQAIENMIQASRQSEGNTLAKLLSLLMVFISATAGFASLQNALNIIWESDNRSSNWLTGIFMERIIAILLILFSGIVLLTLVLVDITLAGFGKVLAYFLPVFTHVYVWKIGVLLVSFLITLLLFAFIYKTLSSRKITWNDVWYGAGISSFLFTIGKFIVADFLSSGRVVTLFGAASSLIAILIWVYFSAQILLLGAAFSYNYSRQYGTLSQDGHQGKKRQQLRRWFRNRRRR